MVRHLQFSSALISPCLLILFRRDNDFFLRYHPAYEKGLWSFAPKYKYWWGNYTELLTTGELQGKVVTLLQSIHHDLLIAENLVALGRLNSTQMPEYNTIMSTFTGLLFDADPDHFDYQWVVDWDWPTDTISAPSLGSSTTPSGSSVSLSSSPSPGSPASTSDWATSTSSPATTSSESQSTEVSIVPPTGTTAPLQTCTFDIECAGSCSEGLGNTCTDFSGDHGTCACYVTQPPPSPTDCSPLRWCWKVEDTEGDYCYYSCPTDGHYEDRGPCPDYMRPLDC